MQRNRSRSTGKSKTRNALDLLKTDHAEVKQLFKRFETLRKQGNIDGMRAIMQAACKALTIHARIEEEIFYPALRDAVEATDALDEASVEHSHIKELVSQLEASAPGNESFEARATVLSEYVAHHVKEEETRLFAEARRARFDLAALGDQLQARKDELSEEGPPIDMEALTASRANAKQTGHRARR